MSEKENSGFDLSDLEKEIDSAVDKLLIAKEEQLGPTNHRSNQSTKATTSIQEEDKSENFLSVPFAQPQTEFTKVTPIIATSVNKIKEGSPFLSSEQQTLSQKVSSNSQGTDKAETTILPSHTQSKSMGELREKLDEVEAQLLTLEWDLNTRNINKAITYLQDLTRHSKLENELAKVITLIQKVLYQLILDETKLTPIAFKFLQKSWKAVRGMTDERFYLEIDKEALVNEVLSEFQKLKIDQESKEKPEKIDEQESFASVMTPSEVTEIKKTKGDSYLYQEIDNIVDRLEKLARVVSEEQSKWTNIQQEIINFKNDLQKKFDSIERISKEEKDDFDRSSNIEYQFIEKKSVLLVSLIKISGVIFGFPEKQIVRSFPIKKWVSDFCIAKGKVKLKDREIPLFNLCQVFKLKPSLEDNPLVLLIRGRANHPAAVIIDQVVSNEEIAYEPITGKPYIFGQGISQGAKVWLLDADQISP
jgi:hypothetical protein